MKKYLYLSLFIIGCAVHSPYAWFASNEKDEDYSDEFRL